MDFASAATTAAPILQPAGRPGNSREPHPLSRIIPAMDAEQYAELRASIRDNGVQTPITVYEGKILDGVHRALAAAEVGRDCPEVEYDGDNPKLFVLLQNLHRRHLSPGQRAAIIAEHVDTPKRGGRPKKRQENSCLSAPAAASAVGVDESAVRRARKVFDESKETGDATLWNAVKSGEVAPADGAAIVGQPVETQRAAVEAVQTGAEKTVKKAAAKADRERRQAEAREAARTAPPAEDLFCCPVSELHRHIEAGTVDAVITDAPFLSIDIACGIYRQLAEFCVHAVRPGGLVMAILPHTQPLQVLQQMDVDGLTYRWLVTWTQPASNQRIHSVQVVNGWKPWMVFQRDGAQPDPGYSADWVDAGPPEPGQKGSHPWALSVRGVSRLIERWVKVPGVVCDPFTGSGAVLSAAARLGHRVIGGDIDPACVELTRARLAAVTPAAAPETGAGDSFC